MSLAQIVAAVLFRTMTAEDAADKLGITVRALRQRVARLRARLITEQKKLGRPVTVTTCDRCGAAVHGTRGLRVHRRDCGGKE